MDIIPKEWRQEMTKVRWRFPFYIRYETTIIICTNSTQTKQSYYPPNLEVPGIVGTGGIGRRPFFFLFVRSKGLDGIQVERIVGTHNHSHTGASSTDFFHGNGVWHGIQATAAVFIGNIETHQSQFGLWNWINYRHSFIHSIIQSIIQQLI